MALRHLLLRFTPRLDGRWVIAALVLGVLVAAGTFFYRGGAAPPVDLLALGPEGRFADTVSIPATWADSMTTAPDAVTRVPLILGVRNRGRRPVRPARLSLSLPVRYRLAGEDGQELDGRIEEGSPLITYSFDPGLGAVDPERLPVMLPAHDTLWLEVIVPSYYCVAVADSIPEFVPAPPPPVETLSDIRIFYAFEGGDLGDRRTGTLTVGIDSTLLAIDLPETPPAFEMVNDTELAQPELGPLRRVGSRRARCGEPEAPMELLSTVWETEAGARLIALDYGGTVRKHLYDLDGDGVIERESWAPEGDAFTATRRTALPIPAFLLPETEAGGYDMARFDTLPADSLARLDPYGRAMRGPAAVTDMRSDSVRAVPGIAAPGAAGAARATGQPPVAEEEADSFPVPRIQRPEPLGRPLNPDTSGGGGGGAVDR